MVKSSSCIMQYNFGHTLQDSCDGLFILAILPLSSQSTLSLLLFIIKIEINVWSTVRYITLTLWKHVNFHQHFVNLNNYQKGVYYLGVKVFNCFLLILI
jgi:hypothetical protein